jgi:hypothetical protein
MFKAVSLACTFQYTSFSPLELLLESADMLGAFSASTTTNWANLDRAIAVVIGPSTGLKLHKKLLTVVFRYGIQIIGLRLKFTA